MLFKPPVIRCHRSLPSLWGWVSLPRCSPSPTACTPFPPSWLGFCLRLFPGRDLSHGVVAGSPFALGGLTSPSAAAYFLSTCLPGNPRVPGTARPGDAPGYPWDPEPVAVQGLAGCFWGCLGSPLPHRQPQQFGTGCPVPAPPNSAEIHFYMKSEGIAEAGGLRVLVAAPWGSQ